MFLQKKKSEYPCPDCGHTTVNPEPDDEGDRICEECGCILAEKVGPRMKTSTKVLQLALHVFFDLTISQCLNTFAYRSFAIASTVGLRMSTLNKIIEANTFAKSVEKYFLSR